MKKLLLFLLVLAGGVSTASADWYVAGQKAITNQTEGDDWVSNVDVNKMTSIGNDKYQLVVSNKTLVGNYEFKVTNGTWDDGTSYPTSNYVLKVPFEGVYTITYTFNESDKSVSAEAVLTNGANDIYLRSNKDWNHNDAYKFNQSDGVYTLSVDVSDVNEIFLYRFHVDTWGDDICPNNGSRNHYSINNGILPEYTFTLSNGNYTHANNEYASNFRLPLDSKPLDKIDLTLTVVNDVMTLSMQGYRKATTNAYGYTTFVENNYPLTITDATAYYATDNGNGSAKAYTITNPVANTPMLIKGNLSTTYYFAVAESGTDVSSSNAFHAGSGSAVKSEVDGKHNYILNGDSFYKAAGQTVGTNKAYLQLSQAATARVLLFDDEEETTGITSIKSENSNVYFDLQGRRVAQPTKGLYIVNGKKYFAK